MGEAEWIENLNQSSAYIRIFIFMEKQLPRYWLKPLQQILLIIGMSRLQPWYLKIFMYSIEFIIRGFYEKDLAPETVWFNTNPRNNYFRIEEVSPVHVSFVDGIQCNTGYFKLDNLIK